MAKNHLKKRSTLLVIAAAKSLQLCLTLCDPIDGSPPGSLVPGILQARTLEWVAISFSNAWKWKVNVKSLSCVWLLATPWTAAYQAPLSMIFQARVLEWGAIAFSETNIWHPLKVYDRLVDFNLNEKLTDMVSDSTMLPTFLVFWHNSKDETIPFQ